MKKKSAENEVSPIQKAIALAEMFKISARDISDTYQDKPEDLTAYYNAATKAQEAKGKYAKWTAGTLAVSALVSLLPPVAAVFVLVSVAPAYKFFEKSKDLKKVETTVTNDIASFKTSSKPGEESARTKLAMW